MALVLPFAEHEHDDRVHSFVFRSDEPFDGVKLEEAYQVFGEWDFAILFQADTNDNALHFAADIVRKIDGVAAMRTMPISPLRSWSKP